MVGKILIPEIKSLIDARDFGALRELFQEWPPADVAEVILDMDENDQVIILRVLPHSLAADVFEYLDVEAQQKLLRAMAHERVVGILNEMSPDDRTALLEEMPSAAARQLIKLPTPEERRIAQSLLGYPEGSVGRLMTPDFIAVREDCAAVYPATPGARSRNIIRSLCCHFGRCHRHLHLLLSRGCDFTRRYALTTAAGRDRRIAEKCAGRGERPQLQHFL
jgi:MgtE intracellular N domain